MFHRMIASKKTPTEKLRNLGGLYQRYYRFISFIDPIDNTKVCTSLRIFERNSYDESLITRDREEVGA
jgi:hypothetical protein